MDEKAYAIFSKYYDGAYVNNPNLTDIPFYVDLARRHGGPVLEIACGTGRVLLEIARKGIEIWGVDFSREQLALLESKLAAEPAATRKLVRTFRDDMRTFSLDRRFRLVTIPFRPLQHLYTIDDQISTLNNARRHLTPDGVLAFDVFFPDFAKLLEPLGEEKLDLEWRVPGRPDRVIRRYLRRTKVDLLNQFFEGEFVYRTFDMEMLIEEERAPLKLGYYTYPQLLLLFKQCGLQVAEQYGGFRKEPIDVCKELIFVLRALQ